MRWWDTRSSVNTEKKGKPRMSRGERRATNSPPAALLPREALMRALWRQRAYADRTGESFVFVCVSSVEPGGRFPDDAWRDRFARAVSGLCRSSDAAGWYGENGSDLGIILPDATPQGALRVVRELEATLRAKTGKRSVARLGDPEIACELFVYPGAAFAPVVNWPVRELEAERA